jgi:hypothetical protein
MNVFKRNWPLIVNIVMLGVALMICFQFSIRQNHGHFIYVNDDTYIHMALASNFAQHGVWGVTKYGFTSTSSSLLWTLLLSLVYLLFGINEVSPLILNVIFVTFTCILVYFLLRKYKLQPFFNFVVLFLIIFSTPIPTLIFCGQEHILHLLITISFVYLSAKILSKAKSTLLESSLLLILAPLLIMARYEGIFLVFIVVCLFIGKRKPLYALFLGGLSILPIVIYGLFSVSQGWFFLPNSILLKGKMPDLSSLKGIIKFFGYSGCQQIVNNPHILMLTLGALVTFHFQYSRQKKIWKDSIIMIIIFIVITLLHMQFALTGWFFRYEAYLVGLGIFVIGISLHEYLPEKFPLKINKSLIPKYVGLAFLILLVIFPFVQRGVVSLKNTPQATTNIYEQQYQMGLFLKKFYQDKYVAANDIGYINYLANIECIDLAGLANLEVAKLIRERRYDTQQIYDLTKKKNVQIAMVYEHAFKEYGGGPFNWINVGRLPQQWIKVGEWKISNNVICGDDTVSFYAVDPSEADNLINNLRVFSSLLPKDVVQSGVYTK